MEKIKEFVKEGRVTWTMTTNGYKYYTLNLLTWLKKTNTKLAIVCCDKESELFFRREGYPCIRFQITRNVKQQSLLRREVAQLGLAAFGTEEFKLWNRAKVDILRWIAENAASLGIKQSLYLDGDIVVARDPWEGYEGGLAFQCDCENVNEHTAETSCRAPCTGVIFADHTVENRLVELYTLKEDMWKDAKEQDQPYITNQLISLQIPFTVLPRALYGNGKWQMSKKWRADPWILLHYNYRVGDTKKLAMRADGHWIIPY